MASVTSWVRFEPQTTDSKTMPGLAARLYDPLWTLGRQWQMGEFNGENGGSPISVRMVYDQGEISRFRPGPLGAPGDIRDFDPDREALEALVEQQTRFTGTSTPSPRMSVDAGQHLMRMLDARLMSDEKAALMEVYTFSFDPGQEGLDAASQAYLSIMNGRTLDGARLYEDMCTSGPAFAPSQALGDLLGTWKSWCDGLFVEPGRTTANAAWDSSRMEYNFSIATRERAGETHLHATEYKGGSLDWDAFDKSPGAKLAGRNARPAKRGQLSHSIPSPLTFNGAPDKRFWAFEDRTFDFAAMNTGAEDLLQMLFVEMVMNYGNDWFLLPLRTKFGTVTRIQSLIVQDTFGVRTKIANSADQSDGSWRWFEQAGDQQHGLFLAPVIAQGLESKSQETVDLVRDEMANLAWAVERLVPGVAGIPVDRAESEARKGMAKTIYGSEGEGVAAAKYALMSEVPGNWFPLMPQASTSGGNRTYSLGNVVGRTGDVQSALMTSVSLSIPEEEIPREGAHVTRTHQYVRTPDGAQHSWASYRKRPGRGEVNSNLTFDFVTHSS